jgi:hypothetical protein
MFIFHFLFNVFFSIFDIMDYNKKYMKYYVKTRTILTGGEYNYDIVFLWINKEKISMENNLKMRIKNKLKLFHEQNDGKKIFLYLDFLYTEDSDIVFFINEPYIEVVDIRKLYTIANNDYIQYLFDTQYNIYMRVDVAKIIIQYEHLIKNINNSNYYVVLSDIDILQDIDVPTRGLNCNDNNMMKNFSKNEIFDDTSLKLLNYFGIVMGKKRLSESENNFIICKSDNDVIKSLFDIFINFLFKHIYTLLSTKKNPFEFFKITSDININKYIDNQIIFKCYNWFFGYLNLLKKYIYFRVPIDITTDILKNIPKTFMEGSGDKNMVFIYVENDELFWYINNNYEENKNFYFLNINFEVASRFYGTTCLLTNIGKKIYAENHENIYPYSSPESVERVGYLNKYMRPSKCVKIEVTTTV